MITYSIIQKSQLKGAHRIDAEYYQPEYLEKIRRLKLFPTQQLSEIAYITDGEHGSPIFDETSGIKYFSAQHVKDCLIDSSNAKTISKMIDSRNQRSRLQKGDILLSTVGTIGFAGLVTEDVLPANIDRHVARIALKNNTLDPEFLVAFLNSSYGRFQSVRESTGNVQLNLFIDKIKHLTVPKNNNSFISELIKNSLTELDKSESLYLDAENLLLEELGLKEFKIEDDLFFLVNASDAKLAKRFDAEYFQPKYKQIISNLLRNKTTILASSFQVIRSKSFEYKEEGEVGVIKTKQLNKIEISFETESQTTQDILDREKLPVIKGDDVLFASMGVGSLGKTNIYYQFDSPNRKYTIDSTLRIFRKADKGEVEPEILLVFLNSVVGQTLIYKYVVGTSGIISIYEEDIKNMMIPVLLKETQQKIADLVRHSHEARKKSKELLEEAKRKVEEMIEKGSEG